MKKISFRLMALLFFVAFGMFFLTMAKPAFAHQLEGPSYESISYQGPNEGDDEEGSGDECAPPGPRVNVPEFDPAALTSGLALCLGGTLMLLERIRRRRR
jgi:hypothetical protein